MNSNAEEVSPTGIDRLWNLLDQEGVDGAALIRTLSVDPALKTLFAGSAGVVEGYTVEQHTLRVFHAFADQYGPYSTYYGFKNCRASGFSKP